MGDEDDRLAQVFLQTQQFVLQPLAGDRVDGAERLVHQQHRWIGGQRSGDTDALLLTAGELAGVAVAVLRGIQADQVEEFVDPRGDAILVPLQQFGNDRDVVADREVRKKPRPLDDVADVAAQLVGVTLGDVVVADQDAPAGRFDEAVDHLHRGCLAASRRSDEHHDLTGGNLHRDVVDGRCRPFAVTFGHPVEQDPGTPGASRVRHESPSGW